MNEIGKLRQDAVSIFQAGVKAVDPVSAVKRYLQCKGRFLQVEGRSYDLEDYHAVYVVGAGKASAAMGQAIEDLLGERLVAGILNVKVGYRLPLKKIRVNEVRHPVPDEAGLRGAEQMIKLLEGTGEKDLVFCLISGGGSALLPCPAPGLMLDDKQQVTKAMLECGATIHQINAVRKHISQIKGGRLARLAYPSTLISLILSDVIGDDLDSIASGPTVPDRSTFQDCLSILDQYSVRGKVPPGINDFLEKGSRGKVEETPKEGDPVFEDTQNVIIGSNDLAATAAKQKADELEYRSLLLSTMIEGETREVAKVHTAIAKEILKSGRPVGRPACILSGGETTCTVRGLGLGGRNQEFALAAAIEISGLQNVVILSGGTDGTDGPTDAAGAIVDGQTLRRAQEHGLRAEHFLRENDSYHFFQPLGDLLITGPTYTNVMDLRIVLAT